MFLLPATSNFFEKLVPDYSQCEAAGLPLSGPNPKKVHIGMGQKVKPDQNRKVSLCFLSEHPVLFRVSILWNHPKTPMKPLRRPKFQLAATGREDRFFNIIDVVRDQRRGGLLDLLRRELCAAKDEAKAKGTRPRVISGRVGCCGWVGWIGRNKGIKSFHFWVQVEKIRIHGKTNSTLQGLSALDLLTGTSFLQIS